MTYEFSRLTRMPNWIGSELASNVFLIDGLELVVLKVMRRPPSRTKNDPFDTRIDWPLTGSTIVSSPRATLPLSTKPSLKRTMSARPWHGPDEQAGQQNDRAQNQRQLTRSHRNTLDSSDPVPTGSRRRPPPLSLSRRPGQASHPCADTLKPELSGKTLIFVGDFFQPSL